MARALGRYELIKAIARGGMAEVFLARRRGAAGVEKRLVVKRIRAERARDPRFLRLFVKEARLSMSLVHANIVPVFDFGRVGDALFLVMELVDGRDLGAALQRAGERGVPLDPVLVAFVGAEACQALDYAHGRKDDAGQPLGVVHRDVTPRNVLLSFAGEVKLVDFGVAVLGSDEDRGRIRGTPAYMSPEHARGEAVDARSDLFSLGLVLWEALAGRRVRPGSVPDALLGEARAGDVPPLPDGVPEALRRAVERATRPRPEDRFPSARVMHQALDTFVVTERAARPDLPPPSHMLAAWLAGLFDRTEDTEDDVTGDEGQAHAVTFLDDGEAALVRGLDDAPGEGTMRSVAETMGEPVPPSRRRWPWLAAGAGAIAAAAAVAAWRGPAARSAPDAASPVAAALPAEPAVAPRLDASPPAAPPRRPPPEPRRAAMHPVDINSKPWSRVYIDGKYVDDTPFRATLSAGPHRVRFVNPQDGSTKEITIVVPRDARVIEVLTP